MKSFTTLVSLFTSMTNNTSTLNQTLGAQLISDQARYLIQRYFDNERTYTTTTIGGEDLGITASLVAGAVSATLDTAWPYISCQQLVVFSSGDQRTVVFTQGSTAITWQSGLDEAADDEISTIGVQAYPIPPQVSKIKNDTITVGQLVYTPAPIQTIQEWTMLNALPYTSDIPNYFFIYQNQVNFWPIPSTTGNLITFNYKGRVPDLSIADYAVGSLTGIAAGSNIVTGSGTTWSGIAPLNVDITFLNVFLKITPPQGEGIWYQVKMFTSNTSATLIQPIQVSFSATASAYIIGQLPLLQEDFHDTIVYGAVMTYFSAVKNDDKQYSKFKQLYDTRLVLLEDYAGTKSVNVDLGDQPVPSNPNLFLFAPPQ